MGSVPGGFCITWILFHLGSVSDRFASSGFSMRRVLFVISSNLTVSVSVIDTAKSERQNIAVLLTFAKHKLLIPVIPGIPLKTVKRHLPLSLTLVRNSLLVSTTSAMHASPISVKHRNY